MENPESYDAAAQSHDGFFKAVFSKPERAAEFFKAHLPPAIVARIEWPTLALLPGSFVKSNLQQLHTDLLFSVRIGGIETLLYLLFEHQSRPRKIMPLRMLGYVVEILNERYKACGLPLPPVIPLVFYQGPTEWKFSTVFEDLFALPDDLGEMLLPFLPRFQHALLDLTQIDPANADGEPRLRAVLQLMKLARGRDLLKFFHWLARFPAHEFPDDLLSLMLLYALYSDSDLDAEKIYHSLANNPQLEKATMSVAEKLKAEGRVEGRVEGKAEGRVEGRDEGVLIGEVRQLENFLGLSKSSRQSLEALSANALRARHEELQNQFERRFKGK